MSRLLDSGKSCFEIQTVEADYIITFTCMHRLLDCSDKAVNVIARDGTTLIR